MPRAAPFHRRPHVELRDPAWRKPKRRERNVRRVVQVVAWVVALGIPLLVLIGAWAW